MLLTMSMVCSCSSPKKNAAVSPAYNAHGRTLAAIAATIQSIHDETEDQLIKELFDPTSPAQQNINPYTTMPVIPHTVKEMKYSAGMKEGK